MNRGVPLASWTTLRLGGPATEMTVARSADELVEAIRAVDRAGEPLLVLGGGSNLVVADAGFAGTVVRLAPAAAAGGSAPSGGGETGGARARSDADLAIERDGDDAVCVRAWAGATWDALVARAVEEGWSGVEALSGIPGSVGATPLQNVGAYGQEVSETIARVRVYDRDQGAAAWLDAAECAFAYRASRLRGQDRKIVIEVEFRFPRDARSAPVRYAELARGLGVEVGGRVPLAVARETILRLRRAKGMVLDADDPDTVSAGSFFTNPIVDAGRVEGIATAAGAAPPTFPAAEGQVKLAAAWLIERAGFTKGFMKGRAAISSKHALALTNRGGTTAELLDLARTIRDGVRGRFGVTLEPEPILVGCAL